LERAYDSLAVVKADKRLDLINEAEFSEFTFRELSNISSYIYSDPAYSALRDKALARYERLPAEMKNSERGREIAVWLDPPQRIRIGDPMAEAALADLSGTLHKLSDYKGKYILLDFWSLACGPCLEAFPEMRELAREYADRLTIVGLSRDPEEQWKAASERYGVTWVNLHTSDRIWAEYAVTAMPHQVIISPQGIVLGSWDGYGPGHIREQLKKYLPE
jgi:peroxiredoxin